MNKPIKTTIISNDLTLLAVNQINNDGIDNKLFMKYKVN